MALTKKLTASISRLASELGENIIQSTTEDGTAEYLEPVFGTLMRLHEVASKTSSVTPRTRPPKYAKRL